MGGGHRLNQLGLQAGRTALPPGIGAEARIVALLGFVIAVAGTPRQAVWASAIHLAVLTSIAAIGRIPPWPLIRRVSIVTPFLAGAALLPFISSGARTRVGPFQVSLDGLWAAWNLASKTLLGATASSMLTATTPITDIITGLGRLRVPPLMVSIIAFLVRYLDLIMDQLKRMRISMTARCHDPRWLWQAGPVAASAGTLFVRSYERGERIHQAMVARGFSGTMPILMDERRTGIIAWLAALTPTSIAISATVAAHLTR